MDSDSVNLLIIDGYVDEPGCLGVPPYIAPYPRYIYGAALHSERFARITYATIDQLRTESRDMNSQQKDVHSRVLAMKYDWVIMITGVSVPGNYIGGTPIRYSEIQKYASMFTDSFKILCGPATRFGIGEEGGKPSIPVDSLVPVFDLVITGDAEIVISRILSEYYPLTPGMLPKIRELASLLRSDMDSIAGFAILGAQAILQHPNFNDRDGGNLVCEIETFQGCPRYRSGGCSFCIEPEKGQPIHRRIEAIIDEVATLYRHGARHFRLGNQTDFYAYRHGSYDDERYPRPNPEAIRHLLKGIRDRCPDLKTLHIDNVNALNFALYPVEARQITEAIVEYCTAGNVAAIGVESVDPAVIAKNNLKCTPDEILTAIRIINELGAGIGLNGNPCFLPGLNFIMGLPGETKATLDANLAFLQKILGEKLLIRRINLRKLLAPAKKLAQLGVSSRDFNRQLQKNEKLYFTWKNLVRDSFDMPMLRLVFPFGRILHGVFAELHEGNSTLLRQPGTYPILCYVPKLLSLQREYTLIVVDHGFRSITCLEFPCTLKKMTLNELEHIPGIGKKRAASIIAKNPKTQEDWLQIVDRAIYLALKQIQPDLP
nr:radical SAM protein [Candidatus Sigynarchaeota archaeon]